MTTAFYLLTYRFGFFFIGKATNEVVILQKMMAAGMNIALLNLTFGVKEDHIDMIKKLRHAAKDFSVNMGKNYPLAIAAKLPGRKIRTGKIADVTSYLI